MKNYWKQIKTLYSKRDIAYANMFWLISQAAPYTRQLLIKLAISTVSLGMSFVSTIASKYIVDATTSGSLSWKYIAYMAIASIFSILFMAVSNVFNSYISEKFEFGMRCDMFNQIQHSVWSKISKYHSADIITRLTTDISVISSGLISILPDGVIVGIKLIVSFCILLYFDKWLALFALFIAPVGALSTFLYHRKYRYYYNKLRDSESNYRTFMQENLANIAVVKTFQQEEENSTYMRAIQNERMNLVIKSAKLSAIMSSVMRIIYRSAYVVAFCWSAYRISQGQITYGTMTIFLSLVSHVQGSISSLGSIVPQIYRMLISAKRITDIIGMEKEEYSDISFYPEQISVEIKNVTFAYEKQNILENVNLSIKPGDIIGIIGPSGAGKTTLIRLLLSLIKPNMGTIEYTAGQAFQEVAQPASRRFISYVPQGNTLLSGTIEMNLRRGKKEASEKELWTALHLADAENFVRKADMGLDTILTEKAGGISEGQAQRIAIARALIRNKPLLILDEATSALDEDTEARILSNISENYGKTVLIITHRKSMLRYCNRMIEVSENASVNIKDINIG